MTVQCGALLEMKAEDLGYTAGWRHEKAEQYPDDERNAEAAERMTRLAAELPSLKGSEKGNIFEAFHDFIFSGDDTDNPIEVVRLWGEYRSRIGFDNFPDNAGEYLDALMEIAREAA